MTNRKLYKLVLDGDVVKIHRTDGQGYQATVYRSGDCDAVYGPDAIPYYIVKEAVAMLIKEELE